MPFRMKNQLSATARGKVRDSTTWRQRPRRFIQVFYGGALWAPICHQGRLREPESCQIKRPAVAYNNRARYTLDLGSRLDPISCPMATKNFRLGAMGTSGGALWTPICHQGPLREPESCQPQMIRAPHGDATISYGDGNDTHTYGMDHDGHAGDEVQARSAMMLWAPRVTGFSGDDDAVFWNSGTFWVEHVWAISAIQGGYTDVFDAPSAMFYGASEATGYLFDVNSDGDMTVPFEFNVMRIWVFL